MKKKLNLYLAFMFSLFSCKENEILKKESKSYFNSFICETKPFNSAYFEEEINKKASEVLKVYLLKGKIQIDSTGKISCNAQGNNFLEAINTFLLKCKEDFEDSNNSPSSNDFSEIDLGTITPDTSLEYSKSQSSSSINLNIKSGFTLSDSRKSEPEIYELSLRNSNSTKKSFSISSEEDKNKFQKLHNLYNCLSNEKLIYMYAQPIKEVEKICRTNKDSLLRFIDSLKYYNPWGDDLKPVELFASLASEIEKVIDFLNRNLFKKKEVPNKKKDGDEEFKSFDATKSKINDLIGSFSKLKENLFPEEKILLVPAYLKFRSVKIFSDFTKIINERSKKECRSEFYDKEDSFFCGVFSSLMPAFLQTNSNQKKIIPEEKQALHFIYEMAEKLSSQEKAAKTFSKRSKTSAFNLNLFIKKINRFLNSKNSINIKAEILITLKNFFDFFCEAQNLLSAFYLLPSINKYHISNEVSEPLSNKVLKSVFITFDSIANCSYEFNRLPIKEKINTSNNLKEEIYSLEKGYIEEAINFFIEVLGRMALN